MSSDWETDRDREGGSWKVGRRERGRERGREGEMAGRKGQRSRRERARERGIEVYDKVCEREREREAREGEMYRYIARVREKKRDGHVSRNLLIPRTGA